MIAEEGGQMALQISMQAAGQAISIATSVVHLSEKALAQVLHLGGASLKHAKSAKLDNGQMSVKRLQRLSGGDLHAREVSPELLRSVKADLRRRGVNFSVEKAADGKTYIHFTGRDVDTMSHAMTQAGARLDKRLARSQTRAQDLAGATRAVRERIAAAPRTKRQVLAAIQQRSRTIAAGHSAPARQRTRTQGAR